MVDLLSKLEKEDRQEIKLPILKKSKSIDTLLNGLKRLFDFNKNYPIKRPFQIASILELDYEAKKITSKMDITQNEIQLVYTALIGFQPNEYDYLEMIVGIYLNRLISKSKERELTLDTRPISPRLVDFIGMNNSGKYINVIGNLGKDIGYKMKRGTLIINGDVEVVGYGMLGGTILVNGMCADAGNKMYGGKIICNGNFSAARALGSSYKNRSGFGCDSEGGKIYLNGNYEIIPANTKSDIYHKGKLLFKAGKPVNNDNFWYNELYNAYVPKQKNN